MSEIKIQKTLFPEGLVINPETRQYPTKEMNSLISIIVEIARDKKESKNKKATRKGGLSSKVAGMSEISNQFIREFIAVANLHTH